MNPLTMNTRPNVPFLNVPGQPRGIDTRIGNVFIGVSFPDLAQDGTIMRLHTRGRQYRMSDTEIGVACYLALSRMTTMELIKHHCAHVLSEKTLTYYLTRPDKVMIDTVFREAICMGIVSGMRHGQYWHAEGL